MSYFPYEYYAPTYFPSDYFTFFTVFVLGNTEIEFIFVIQTQMDENLGISIQMDQSLGINRQLEFSVEG